MGLGQQKGAGIFLDNDKSDAIYVRADSFTRLATSFNMIDEQDRGRLRYSSDPNLSRYVVTNYRLVEDRDDAKYAADYDLFYQIRVDNEVILSVFRRKEP